MENWMMSGNSVGSGATRSMPIICTFVELVVLRILGEDKPVLGSLNMFSGCDNHQYFLIDVRGVRRLDGQHTWIPDSSRHLFQ